MHLLIRAVLAAPWQSPALAYMPSLAAKGSPCIASVGKQARAVLLCAHDKNSAPLQARLADERTQRIQAEHDAAEVARHAARVAAQRESSLRVQLALGRQVQPMRMCVYILLLKKKLLDMYARMHL